MSVQGYPDGFIEPSLYCTIFLEHFYASFSPALLCSRSGFWRVMTLLVSSVHGVLKGRVVAKCWLQKSGSAKCWSGLPVPSPVDHILSGLSIMTCPSRGPYTAWLIVHWVRQGCDPSQSVWLVFCDCSFHSVCPRMDEDKRSVQASWWEGMAVGKLGLVLVGKATRFSLGQLLSWVRLCNPMNCSKPTCSVRPLD